MATYSIHIMQYSVRVSGDLDKDRARDVALTIMEGPPLESLISEDCEARILRVIG